MNLPIIVRRGLAAAVLLLAAASLVAQELAVPVLSRRITDLGQLLTEGEAESLEAKLAAFEKATSNQIALLTITSLEGENLEDFSIRVADRNAFGKKGRDNGVLLIISRDDRKLRIEVGRGLEGALTDALSGQIIRHEITPAFRRGHFYEGINAGLEAIMAATRGEYTGDGNGGGGSGIPGFLPFLLLFLMFGVFSLMARARRSTIGRSGFGRGPWIGGGGWGGGGGGWGGGGGGFSGGGGGFGGGGASGSW